LRPPGVLRDNGSRNRCDHRGSPCPRARTRGPRLLRRMVMPPRVPRDVARVSCSGRTRHPQPCRSRH
jgi:hypothetical protein